MVCIHGGASAFASHGEFKKLSQKPLSWSYTPLNFDVSDHPEHTTGVGILPLVVSPTINNTRVTKMLVDGGSSLNLLAVQVMKKLQISQSRLRPTKTFQGINPGETQLLGQITLPATFGSASVIFDVEDILGRPSLAKFMVVSHFAYIVMKVPGPPG